MEVVFELIFRIAILAIQGVVVLLLSIFSKRFRKNLKIDWQKSFLNKFIIVFDAVFLIVSIVVSFYIWVLPKL